MQYFAILVPPALCRQAGVNGNGDGGRFDCGLIACPVGYHSLTGISGKGQECLPCDGEAPYLGSKVCTKSNRKSSKHLGLSMNKNSSTSEGGSIGMGVIVFISVTAGFALLVHAYRRYRRIAREGRVRLYQDVLEEVDDFDTERFDIS